MLNEATCRAARTAIQEEVQKIMRDDLADGLKRELWRIQKLKAIDNYGKSLRQVHDEALDLRKDIVTTDARETLDLIMSIARYELDVHPFDRGTKRP